MIKLFCKDVGVPTSFIVDPSGYKTKNEVQPFCYKVSTTLIFLEELTQHENGAELYVGFVKEGVRKDTQGTYSPDALWFYAVE